MTLVKFANAQNKGLRSPYTDIFGSLFNPEPLFPKTWSAKIPAVNIAESAQEFHLELAAPGLKKEDFKISMEGDQLNVSVERKEETEENNADRKYSRKEFSYSSFNRLFTLPDSADQDKIKAEYLDGVLSITIPKLEETKIQVKEIEVK